MQHGTKEGEKIGGNDRSADARKQGAGAAMRPDKRSAWARHGAWTRPHGAIQDAQTPTTAQRYGQNRRECSARVAERTRTCHAPARLPGAPRKPQNTAAWRKQQAAVHAGERKSEHHQPQRTQPRKQFRRLNPHELPAAPAPPAPVRPSGRTKNYPAGNAASWS